MLLLVAAKQKINKTDILRIVYVLCFSNNLIVYDSRTCICVYVCVHVANAVILVDANKFELSSASYGDLFFSYYIRLLLLVFACFSLTHEAIGWDKLPIFTFNPVPFRSLFQCLFT